MRKLAAWGLSAALLASAATALARAGDEGSDSPPTPRGSIRWNPAFAKMFHIDESKPAPPKKTEKQPVKDDTAAKKSEAAPAPTSAAREAADERSREETTLLRRLQVCDKLQEIAVRTNDTELLRRAETLTERVSTTYSQRTAHLRGVTADDSTTNKSSSPAARTPGRTPPAAGYTVPGNAPARKTPALEGS